MDIILPEIVATGIYNSQIAVRGKTTTKGRKTTMFEIEIPLENGGISYINSEKAPISTDMIICAKPGQLRYTKLPFKCYYIHMIVNGGALYDLLTDIPNFVTDIKREKYYSLFKKFDDIFYSAVESNEILLQSLVLNLIYTLSKDAKKLITKEKLKTSNQKVIEDVIGYIKENLTSDLSLEKVSSYAGFSPIHFHNCFKASTGRTLREYVEEQRIKKATNMLVTTNHTLTEIAYECGFSSQSYFSYAFKRKMGLSPRGYAKKMHMEYEV